MSSQIRIALATDAISQDLETAALLALEWGVEALELKRFSYKRVPEFSNDQVSEIQRIQARYPIELVSLSPGAFKGALTVVEIDIGLKRIADTIALGATLGIDRLIVFGFEKDDFPETALDRLIPVFREVERMVREARMTAFIENDRGHWLNDPLLLEATVRTVNSPHLRVNWDPCNLIGEIPIDQIRESHARISDLIGHVHVKDARSLGGGAWEHAMLGEGHVDWEFHIRELGLAQFAGCAVIEPHFGHRIFGTSEHVKALRRLMDAGTA